MRFFVFFSFFFFFFFLMIRRPPRSTLFPYTTSSDLAERRRLLRAGHPRHPANREGILGARHGATGAAALPRDQLAHVVQPLRQRPGGLVPDADQRGVAEAAAVGAADAPGGGGTRGDRAAGRRGRAPPGAAAHARGRPDDPRDLPAAERLPSSGHVLPAGDRKSVV